MESDFMPDDFIETYEDEASMESFDGGLESVLEGTLNVGGEGSSNGGMVGRESRNDKEKCVDPIERLAECNVLPPGDIKDSENSESTSGNNENSVNSGPSRNRSGSAGSSKRNGGARSAQKESDGVKVPAKSRKRKADDESDAKTSKSSKRKSVVSSVSTSGDDTSSNATSSGGGGSNSHGKGRSSGRDVCKSSGDEHNAIVRSRDARHDGQTSHISGGRGGGDGVNEEERHTRYIANILAMQESMKKEREQNLGSSSVDLVALGEKIRECNGKAIYSLDAFLICNKPQLLCYGLFINERGEVSIATRELEVNYKGLIATSPNLDVTLTDDTKKRMNKKWWKVPKMFHQRINDLQNQSVVQKNGEKWFVMTLSGYYISSMVDKNTKEKITTFCPNLTFSSYTILNE